MLYLYGFIWSILVVWCLQDILRETRKVNRNISWLARQLDNDLTELL